MTVDTRTQVRILGEDGPPGETTDLLIVLGGNGDYYIGVEGPDDFGELRRLSLMARFCTSGERCTATTFLIKMLFLVGCGEPEQAKAMLEPLLHFLEGPHEFPDPEEADAAYRVAVLASKRKETT